MDDTAAKAAGLRIAELEAEIERLRTRVAIAKDVEINLLREIKRLRKLIKNAPHGYFCDDDRRGGKCDCWKRNALNEVE